MLHLLFKAAKTRYALPAREVEEVLPLVGLAALPGAPDYVAGLMNHRGTGLPVADLTVLLAGRRSRPFASTRIVVARAAPGLRAGFMAERVLRTQDFDPAGARPPGAPAAPFVSRVFAWEGELVEVLDLSRIIPPELAERLRALAEAA